MENPSVSTATRQIPARILVVDDEATILSVVKRTLVRARYQVDTAGDGYQALELLQRQRYDLLVSDVNMPGFSGMELLTRCRQEHPGVKVILMTGMPDVRDAVSSIQTGACDYLVKPVEMAVLQKKVEEVLEKRRKEGSGTAVLTPETAHVFGRRFRIIRTLGRGATGIVFLVQKGDQSYAMKILQCWEGATCGDEILNRFFREAEILEKIEHPGVVRIYEHGRDSADNIPYILMEFVSGRTLGDHIANGALSFSTRLSLVRQIATALDAVHRHGILHRDLKPQNVMVTDDFQAKLTDFGVAYVAGSSLTVVGSLIGSPAYMAPENFLSRPIDERSDIFSLGVLAYELLTGAKPFKGENLSQVGYAIVEARPQDPAALRPELPGRVAATVLKMLARDPDARFPTAAAVAQAIGECEREQHGPCR
jgi:DNA-binding response OmpR family regulator